MKRFLAIAIATLVGSSAIAAEKHGASGMSPGRQMQNSTSTTTTKGASEYAPGDRMQDKGTVGTAKGASEYSPGDRMNDKRKK